MIVQHYHFTNRIHEELGNGQYGVVNRGVWSVEEEEREVAVKSPTDGSTEEKRIEFLQEAAIIGQFRHPNVLALCGIAMTREPVSNRASATL